MQQLPTLSAIVGQEEALSLLRAALASHRLSGSYLFHGPRGVGKRSTCLALARAVNCQSNPLNGCEDCTACLKIIAGTHPDVLVLEAEERSEIKISQVRELQKHLGYRPFEGRSRVVIIRDAHRLNLNSANALLKSIEEPRADTLFLLSTDRPRQVLPTVRSRCQPVRFRRLLKAQVLDALPPADEFSADLVDSALGQADGSPGRALALLKGGNLTQATALAQALVRASAAGSAADITRLSETAAQQQELLGDALAQVRVILREQLLAAVQWNGDERSSASTTPSVPTASTQASHRGSVQDRLDALSAVEEADTRLQGNANPRLTVESLALSLAHCYRSTLVG